MASRNFYKNLNTLETELVEIYGQFSVGASGAVTAGTVVGMGVSAVVKEATAGQYSITLSDQYNRLIDWDFKIADDAISQIYEIQVLENPATLQADFLADSTLKIQCLGPTAADDTALVAANPASGALVKFKFVLRNSSVSPAGL